jgi:hypothetical protein
LFWQKYKGKEEFFIVTNGDSPLSDWEAGMEGGLLSK